MSVLRKPRLLALAVALASLAALAVFGLVAPTTLAANPKSPDSHPPKAVLMKGDTAIQEGRRGSTCWHYWNETRDYWVRYCADDFVVKKKDAYPHRCPQAARFA